MTETKKTFWGKIGAFFGRIWAFIKRHKKLFIFLVILAVIVAIVLNLLGGMQSAAASFAQAPQTTALARMDLEQIVSGTGTLQSATTREVTSSLSYTIDEVYVKEGHKVQAGDPLAQLDTTELDKTIAATRKSIADAQASDALSLTQAQRKLQDAKDSRDINWDKNTRNINEAADTLQAAREAAGNAAAAATDRTALANAEAAEVAARTSLDTAQAALNALDPADPSYATAQGQLDAAQTAYNNASTTLTQEQAAYESAVQANYQTAYDNGGAAEQKTYNQAVETRETAKRNDDISVQNAQDTVDTARLRDSAASYRTQLEGYLEDLEDCTIKAPVAGTVTSMAAEAGKSAGGGSMGGTATTTTSTALFVIEDTDKLEITTSIPEYDAVLLRIGLPATITSDALDGEEWQGTVKSISPKATDTSGNFTVVVQVSSPVGQLAIGMSTKLNIITESKSDVFAVPYDAVTANTLGESIVYAYVTDSTGTDATTPGGMAGGNPPEDFDPENLPEGFAGRGSAGASGGETPTAARVEIPVETGMETDYYIEISGSGLQEGLLILTDPEGKNVSTGATGGFPFGGGMMGG